MAKFIKASEAPVTNLPGGLVRKVLCHNEELMVVEIEFPAGAPGGLHTHPHVQSTYVKSGVFEYAIGEEKFIMHAGDSIVVESNAPHGCSCIEAGVILDIFTPVREDFLK